MYRYHHGRRTIRRVPSRRYTVRTGTTTVTDRVVQAHRTHPLLGTIAVHRETQRTITRAETLTRSQLLRRFHMSSTMLGAVETGAGSSRTIAALRKRGLWDTVQMEDIRKALRS